MCLPRGEMGDGRRKFGGSGCCKEKVQKVKFFRSHHVVSFPLCVCVSVCAFYVYVPLRPDNMAN